MKNSFYITTTLPYVNSDPHVGFAMEFIRADVIARFKKLNGYEVFFNTGTDEHGQKLFDSAKKEGKEVQVYVDEYAEKFRDLKNVLGISEDVHFVRTTDEHHIKSAQEFWKICKENGYIYKKTYQAKYCVGCELNKTDSELVDGECPIHPGRKLELIDEENYFFKFSEFQKPLLDFYVKNPNFVVPDFRFHEIKAFIGAGLDDFSISRLKSKMSWGVPVPDDDKHVMYVWFDALVNYISTLGWPENKEQFEKFWVNGTPVQYCGKDNLRQQTAMWQAMLMSVKLPNTHQVIVDGFITGDGGIKMSKSIGNVVNPVEIVKEYGTDALRYFLLREVSSFEDSPFTIERFKEAYNSGLANGLGNLSSRILTLSEKHLDKCPEIPEKLDFTEYFKIYEDFDIKKVMDYIWDKIQNLDKKIQETEPFKVIKIDEQKGKEMIKELVLELYTIARMLNPVMPETNEKLKKLIKENKKPEQPLFLRKE
ncbi:MAG: methionine--tRNA ligase [Candidatus Paceibacterota bacterium]|jgi:methionyl-tRNA synthetase